MMFVKMLKENSPKIAEAIKVASFVTRSFHSHRCETFVCIYIRYTTFEMMLACTRCNDGKKNDGRKGIIILPATPSRERSSADSNKHQNWKCDNYNEVQNDFRVLHRLTSLLSFVVAPRFIRTINSSSWVGGEVQWKVGGQKVEGNSSRRADEKILNLSLIDFENRLSVS